jgi:SAM-dependent methyltransferase
MKLKVAGENPIERIALALGIPPVTLMDTHVSFLRARTIMVATKLGLFDALASAPLDAAAVAARCGTAPAATEKLLNALAGSGYLHFASGVYSLSPVARKWLLIGAPTSVRDKVLFEFFEWSMLEHMEEFVRSGQPLEMHSKVPDEAWGAYQRAMRALSGLAAPEVVRRTPMPGNATTMLDVGGSHGYISAALSDDLGDAVWDFIYVSQLLHHFDEATNRNFARRVARALKPGGLFVVLEMIRPSTPTEAGQVGALLDLYFALTSQSGTWSIDEIAAWQSDAGLAPLKPVRLRTVPGAVEVVASKGNLRSAPSAARELVHGRQPVASSP